MPPLAVTASPVSPFFSFANHWAKIWKNTAKDTFTSKCPETNWLDLLNSSLQALVLSHLSDLELCGLSAVSKNWAALLAVCRPRTGR